MERDIYMPLCIFYCKYTVYLYMPLLMKLLTLAILNVGMIITTPT